MSLPYLRIDMAEFETAWRKHAGILDEDELYGNSWELVSSAIIRLFPAIVSSFVVNRDDIHLVFTDISARTDFILRHGPFTDPETDISNKRSVGEKIYDEWDGND